MLGVGLDESLNSLFSQELASWVKWGQGSVKVMGCPRLWLPVYQLVWKYLDVFQDHLSHTGAEATEFQLGITTSRQ